MSLARFTLIVAIDSQGGISKDGWMPWQSNDDMKFFRDTTIGNKKNVVIMGRDTYEKLPDGFRPLPSRKCVVISSIMRQVDYQDILIFSSISDALKSLGQTENLYDDVFIAGGERIYAEAVRDWMHLCKRVYVTQFKVDYKCDKTFPIEAIEKMCTRTDTVKTRDFVRTIYTPNVRHSEYEFLELLRDISQNGERKSDRTGKGTKSLFGTRVMSFDISERIPILTTKKVNYNAIIKELLFFISGKTDTKLLEKDGVMIWKGNTSNDFLESMGLKYREGDMGPMYGYQWRHWNHPYTGCDNVPEIGHGGIDQLKKVIEQIRREPHSRRHILSAWNVEQLDEGVLAPCHSFVQFNVSGDRTFLDCMLYQRSGDMFLGVPFNIASYSILTYMIAHVCGLVPRCLRVCIGDAHIYSSHESQVSKQLTRTPYPYPRLSFRGASLIKDIDDFKFDNFIVDDYQSWPYLQAEMAI